MRVITGKARGIQLKTPDGMLTRPTADRVKEALFSVIQFDIPGARVLDLFGGTGQLGIEALSRGANIFDKLIVCVMVNAGKNPMFTLEERVELIRRVTSDLPNVEVDCSAELLADYARRRGSCVVLKGLRAGSDFENEFQMALINRKINPELDTMFLTACSEYMYLSSSLVKELGSYGADLSDFLPAEIIPDFQRRIEQRRLSLQGGK